MQVDLGVDREAGELDLPALCDNGDRAFETGGPAGREKLLGIGAGTRCAGHGQLDAKLAVGAAGLAVFAPTDRVDLRRIDDLARGLRVADLLELSHSCLLDVEVRRAVTRQPP